jgi:DNA modification methylase
MEYIDFIKSKKYRLKPNGINIELDQVNEKLFDFQKDIVKWACKKGRCAIFLDTGLGKTFVQLEFARLINKRTIIIAPLSVARQTVREAKKINIDVQYVREQSEVNNKICITNYELISNFDFSQFENIILDESSILKSLDGKIKKKLFEVSRNILYRMACTATPAPNDDAEMGNHAQYLGICTREEMLAMFFVNANLQKEIMFNDQIIRKKMGNKHGTEWRLKNHSRQHFYQWLSSWAICMEKPSDLGYSDEGFILPQLNIIKKYVDVDYKSQKELFFTGLKGITDRLNVKKNVIEKKLPEFKNIVDGIKDQLIVWVYLQKEADLILELLKGYDIKEIKGADSPEYKAKTIEDFQDGKFKILLTKPKIAGFGMNFQNSHKMVFFGLNDSWEMYYQAIRREWRFMQIYEVDVFVLLANVEQEIYQNIQRKDTNAKILKAELISAMKKYEKGELMNQEHSSTEKLETQIVETENYKLIRGDSCQELPNIKDESVDLSAYSPPFVDLFTYSSSDYDLGNSKNRDEFFNHYSFIIKELLRITKPGRLTCVHVSDIPALQQKDGFIGVKDFPGEVIKEYQKAGWIFHGRVFIQKNPQAQAIRTHSKALLFVQMRKDSCDSRPALVDQILLFKKDGENQIPVNPVDNKELDNEKWISWAHGIWTDIRETETLRVGEARHKDDEKHICPLQLETIERCIKLYSNPGETILTPFGGIGSEPYQALKFGRKAIAIELKKSYFDLMVKNINTIDVAKNQGDLFKEAI